MENDKLLIIPIELFQREIYSRLYLGLSMIEKGYDVIICDQLNPILGNIFGGVVFHKDHAQWSLDYIMKFKKRGTKIIVHDIEGLILTDEQRYLNARVSPAVFEQVDTILCWGKTQSSIIQKVTQSDKLRLAGDLRFDIARKYKKQSNTLKSVENILFNTRFTYSNPIQNTNIIKTFTELGYLKTEDDIKKFQQIIANDKLIFKEFLVSIKLLLQQGKNIVIRPHPAENINSYTGLFSDLVKIDRQTSLSKQIDWADCVIHDGCTTALEARAQGKLVFSLRPELSGGVYDEYANKFSNFHFKSSFDLTEKINEDLKPLSASNLQVNLDVDSDIFNFFDDKPYFVNVFYDVLNSYKQVGYRVRRGINKDYLRKAIKYSIYILIKKLRLKFLYKSRLVHGIEKYEEKFGELSITQIVKICREIESRVIKKRLNYKIEKLNSKAFILKRKSGISFKS